MFAREPEKTDTSLQLWMYVKKIVGCLSCEYCHTKGEGRCVH
ncbi:hypothetical protein CLOSTMETH_01835 [[Clostridium] methylpentosum DSM 5476]|uniref:Uncharacterized protein n=1 Tax=[Clostridium] methylpentosum DSM 5476 TaxID=537013 RepID=C0EDA8_9FIRM|nr:hypothetical protein CLOSTMETH_01835 [[Clostridium] methylpentosum DSM 5476]